MIGTSVVKQRCGQFAPRRMARTVRFDQELRELQHIHVQLPELIRCVLLGGRTERLHEGVEIEHALNRIVTNC